MGDIVNDISPPALLSLALGSSQPVELFTDTYPNPTVPQDCHLDYGIRLKLVPTYEIIFSVFISVMRSSLLCLPSHLVTSSERYYLVAQFFSALGRTLLTLVLQIG
jgi:hypothetical protein